MWFKVFRLIRFLGDGLLEFKLSVYSDVVQLISEPWTTKKNYSSSNYNTPIKDSRLITKNIHHFIILISKMQG